MKIAIMMSVWCQNLWDELILKNEIELLRKKYGEHTEFIVFTYDIEYIFYADSSIKYVEYFPIGIKKPKNIFRNIRNLLNFIKVIFSSDLVVFWWWWIFFDTEKGNYSNPLVQWKYRMMLLKILRKKYILFWVSIDIQNPSNQIYMKKVFSNAARIYVRDQSSYDFLHDLWVSSQIILDVVFHDNGKKGLQNYKKNFLQRSIKAQNFNLEDIKNINFSWKKVGLALRKWYVSNETETLINIRDFIIAQWWQVIFLPHSFHMTDNEANDFLFLNSFMIPWTKITNNMYETYFMYKQGKIDICFSMRLHSMILSQVYGIDFFALKYAKKSDLM